MGVLMMSKDIFSKKFLNVALLLLLIVSLVFNVKYFRTIQSNENNNTKMYQYYAEEYAITFSNALYIPEDQEMHERLKDPNHVSDIIEGIKLAQFQSIVANKYITGSEIKIGRLSTFQSRNLITGYLYELRKYRSFLYTGNEQNGYENINNIYTIIDDLTKISIWLMENADFSIHKDLDLNQELYPVLKSDLKFMLLQ